MIVSIALFTVVATVAIGAVLKVIDANKKSQTLKTTISNMNFALDTMTREMRVGTNYNCYTGISSIPTTLNTSSECPAGYSGTWAVAFNSSKSALKDNGTEKCKLIHAYYFDGPNSSLWKGEQEKCDDTVVFVPMIYTNPSASTALKNDLDIVFTYGFLKVRTSGQQPFAQVRFSGYAGAKNKIRSYFDVQTSMSQRLSD